MSVALVAVGVGTAAIGAYSSNKASKAQAKSADAATLAQSEAADDSNALQKSMYDTNRADAMPWRDAGEGALNQLAWKMGVTPEASQGPQDGSTFDGAAYLRANPDVARSSRYSKDPYSHYLRHGKNEGRKAVFTQPKVDQYKGNASEFGSLSRSFTLDDYKADPGYQFRLDEGNRGVERSAAARGGQLSGATMKALQKYGQGMASDEYGNAYNRFNNDQTTQYNRLSGIAGTGQQASNQIGQYGSNYANQVGSTNMNTANQIGSNMIGAGNARAGSYMATANSINGAIGTGVNTYQQQQYLNNMNNMTAYGTTPGSQQSNMLAAQW